MSPSIESGRPLLAGWRRIPGPPRDYAKARLLRLYVALERRFGAQHWWLHRTSFEIAVGAVLVRLTAWPDAARAIRELRSRGLLNPAQLAAATARDVADAVQAAGASRVTARPVRAFTRWLLERFGGRFHGMRRAPLSSLRKNLLGVAGIGRETADVILLYAAHRPVFAVNEYTRRVLSRHQLIPPRAPYEAMRAFMEAHLPSDPVLFGEYRALLVAVGKVYCRAVPRCDPCPLRFDLINVVGRRGRRRPGARRRSARPGPEPDRPSP
jgi:endonuclease III related protein